MFTPNFAEVIQTEDNTIEMKVQEAVKIQVRGRPLKKTSGLSFQDIRNRNHLLKGTDEGWSIWRKPDRRSYVNIPSHQPNGTECSGTDKGWSI